MEVQIYRSKIVKLTVYITESGAPYGAWVGRGHLLIDRKPKGNCGFIEDVEVKEDHRGEGYGRKVIEELIEIARENKCYKVILDCADHNVPLYEKFGFEKWENSMRLDLV